MLYQFQLLSACRSNISENLETVDRALESVGISHEERNRIYKILAAILHLGNVDIEEEISSEKCKISELSKIHLKHTAKLLNIEQQTLEIALLTRTIEINGSNQIM